MAASADAAPSYWETTVHAPSALDLNGDMIIDELPTGSVVVFVFTTLISWFFQLPGFLLTYLLHGTHAGRFGSLAGLALTFIQWGFGTTVMGAFPPPNEPPQDGSDYGMAPGDGTSPTDGSSVGGIPAGGAAGNSTTGGNGGPTLGDMQAGHEWVSFVLMTLGPSPFPFASLSPRNVTDGMYKPYDRLVPAPHVADWLLPCEKIRVVRARVAYKSLRARSR